MHHVCAGKDNVTSEEVNISRGPRWVMAGLTSYLICAPVFAVPPEIALDIGHTSTRAGAISARGRPEYEFNRELVKTINAALTSKGVTTTVIGQDAPPVSLEARTAAAKARGASFFLAVHHDSAQAQYQQVWEWKGVARRYSDAFSGFSLFVSRKNPDIDTSLQCARAIGSAFIEAGYHPSEHHAEKIPGENREWADQARDVYYFDDLVVLKTASSPAVLLEAGVIINRGEEVWLELDTTRDMIAHAVSDGLVNCKIVH
jgi:N-acetylmuramoyl-L-alanine amidase